MTHLRQMMLDELQRRNDSQSTVRSYIFAVEDFAKYFHRSPERLGPEHIRQYQAYLFRERKLSPGTIEGRTAALHFLFIKTRRRAGGPGLDFEIRERAKRFCPHRTCPIEIAPRIRRYRKADCPKAGGIPGNAKLVPGNAEGSPDERF